MPKGPKEFKPVPSVIVGDNDDLILAVSRLYCKDPKAKVIDLTYGRGMWWKKFEPVDFVTNDLYTEADYHCDYRRPFFPEWKDHFNVVAYDPAYTSTGSLDKSTLPGRTAAKAGADFHRRYGLDKAEKGWKKVFADMSLGLSQAVVITKPGGLIWVKCSNYVESGEMHWGRDFMVDYAVDELGLVMQDEFIHFSGPGAQPKRNLDGTVRKQKHTRSHHSFLLVLKKPRRPAKPTPKALELQLSRSIGEQIQKSIEKLENGMVIPRLEVVK